MESLRTEGERDLSPETRRNALIEWSGRTGYAAKGFVYLIIGGLALMQVLGVGGAGRSGSAGSKGALVALDQQPYGDILLYILAIGLATYTVWRWAQGILDVENKGDEGSDLIRRAGLVISGALYGYLAYAAIRLAQSAGATGASDSGSQKASEAMSLPGGTWLVVAVGAGFAVTGIYQAWRAYSLDFQKHWKRSLNGRQRHWATQISRFGIAARAVIFVMMGGYVALAGLNADPDQSRGLGGVLRSFADEPWLLGTTAVGLVCYAIYCWVNAAYRRIPATQSTFSA